METEPAQEKWDMYTIPGMIPKLCEEYGISKKAMDTFDNWLHETMQK